LLEDLFFEKAQATNTPRHATTTAIPAPQDTPTPGAPPEATPTPSDAPSHTLLSLPVFVVYVLVFSLP